MRVCVGAASADSVQNGIYEHLSPMSFMTTNLIYLSPVTFRTLPDIGLMPNQYT